MVGMAKAKCSFVIRVEQIGQYHNTSGVKNVDTEREAGKPSAFAIKIVEQAYRSNAVHRLPQLPLSRPSLLHASSSKNDRLRGSTNRRTPTRENSLSSYHIHPWCHGSVEEKARVHSEGLCEWVLPPPVIRLVVLL